MRRVFSKALFLIMAATGVFAQDADVIPQKRLIYSKDLDFYGADLTNLFDTTRKACERACLSNDKCTAFTFNQRSNACFPKSGVSDKQVYEGALSAEVYSSAFDTRERSRDRAADLKFLRGSDLQTAYQQALDLGHLHPGGQWGVDVLLKAVRERRSENRLKSALHWMGAATAQSDASEHWLDYARLAMQQKPGSSSATRRMMDRALSASINAYLRAPGIGAQVSALDVMARVLEKTGRGRDMIAPLRLAQVLQPRDDVMAQLEKAVGKYGFRVTEHRVENDLANPRICAEFSEALAKTGVDYATYLRLPDPSFAVEASGKQICIDGVEHGTRYQVTFRAGLPAANGETLVKDVPLALYVGDRTASVRFPGRAYVLPKSADAAIPLVSVNLSEVDLLLRRVSDRNILRSIQGNFFGKQLDEYQDERFKKNIGEEIWTGTGSVENSLNQDVTTRLPVGDLIQDLPAGLYALTARVPGRDIYEDAGVTQWFVLSDLGLSTLSGSDGVHVFARSLSSAGAVENATVTLLSRSNRVLGQAQTDAKGYARFEAGLTRGTGAAAPALIMAEVAGDQDMTFMSLTGPAFDLSDRGVEGRSPAGPVDLFVTPDRGAYRAGETIYVTALARDGTAKAIEGLPITAILNRPDGVEYSRIVSTQDKAGGHVFALPLGATVPRGTWTLELKSDPKAPALAQHKILVEDFLPERIDFDLAFPNAPIRLGETPPLTISARYLFGAPGADLPVQGYASVAPVSSLKGFEGYSFGRYDAPVQKRTQYFKSAPRTNSDGQAIVAVDMPTFKSAPVPMELTATVQVSEGSGRPVERQIKRALAPSSAMIGIKPLFDGVVDQGSEAAIDVIAISPDQTPLPMNVRWTLNRVETRYQWYNLYGDWAWEPVTTRKRVAADTVMIDGRLSLSLPVDWGRYELVVERMDGSSVVSSIEFYAGWYAPADTSETPDTLSVSLDKPGYASGETAQLRLVPRHAGTALITVMSNRVIHMESVEVTKGENLIPLTVTDDWGAGAYVTASVIRPMDVASRQNPARVLGLAYAPIDPVDKKLAVQIETPNSAAPRGPLSARVKVEGIGTKEHAFVTVAAIDLGILNLTGFDSPDPSDHYFGQRRLGMEMRDVYGRLIDGMNGAMGQVRSGGDAGSRLRLQSPPPTQDLVAYFSGAVEVGPDGYADVTFDVPAFNGTVRLMAVAWSETGVGQAESDVLVRDPVVVTASVPRFLAPGDTSSALIEITHATGPSGRMDLDLSASGLDLDTGAVPSQIDLGELQKRSLRVPLSASSVGDHTIRIAVTSPDGKRFEQSLTVPVRANDPEVGAVRRISLAPGDRLDLNDSVFADYKAGTGKATVSAGPLSRLNVAQLMQNLDRYPYGCTEQITSKAMPLLYLSSVSEALGLGAQAKTRQRIDQAIEQVLTRQTSGGAFGLWRAQSGEFWLDAYVADFLSRAKAQGFEVPKIAFRQAMDNLRNRINYAPDFDKGGEDIAYALMVLAREGAASMGDLRYYVDVKGDAFSTPLAAAQLAAALASYGDQTRSDAMFARAARLMIPRMQKDAREWRADFGSNLRDAAGVLSLASAAGSETVNGQALVDFIAGTPRQAFSTQEAAWTLMAAHSLIDDPVSSALALNGNPVSGPLMRSFDAKSAPLEITNTSGAPIEIALNTIGVPQVPAQPGGYGYKISRAYYQMDGRPVTDLALISGTRLVTVLTVTPFEEGASRLMVKDPLPAGFEIDNPTLLRGGDVRALDWLKPAPTEFSEFRSDRFLAAVDWRKAEPFQLAYIVRAVSAGSYHHPAASVEDMYRPQYRAQGASGRMTVTQ